MGYESKIYVVEKKEKEIFKSDGFWWAEVIASFDLSKMPFSFTELFKNDSNCYIYADDGDAHITEDKYGDFLKQCCFEDVIIYLEELVLENEYRRLNPFLQMLKGFNLEQWDNLTLLHFGY